MKKFKFSFDRLLKLKKLNEDIKKKELAGLNAIVNRLNKEIEILKEEQLKIKTHYMNKKQLKVSELVELSQYEKTTENSINYKLNEIEKTEILINSTKLQLLNLMRERKVLESLKEKKKADYLQELSRAIDTEATDLFLMRRSNV